LHRRPTGIEVLNDLDADIHNMFSAIRNPVTCTELQHLLLWSADGRRQFQECKAALDDPDPVRRAWAFLVPGSTGDIRSYVRRRSWPNAKHRLCTVPERLEWWRARLQRVKLECRPWQDILDRYDRDGTLLYLDPLCCPQHNGSSVAQAVMWPSSFLRPYFSVSPIFCAT
jgi:DNA adenine methylase